MQSQALLLVDASDVVFRSSQQTHLDDCFEVRHTLIRVGGKVFTARVNLGNFGSKVRLHVRRQCELMKGPGHRNTRRVVSCVRSDQSPLEVCSEINGPASKKTPTFPLISAPFNRSFSFSQLFALTAVRRQVCRQPRKTKTHS